MDIQSVTLHKRTFGGITHLIQDNEGKESIGVWFARELQSVLGYVHRENFPVSIKRAIESCKSQNDDPKKEGIVFAQGYFALQTRKVELIAEHLQQISRPLADFLPTLTIAAKNLANEMTN